MAITKRKKTYTRVVFRVFKHGIGKGEVIALFIDDVWDFHGNIASYMHVGQHSGADYNGIIQATRKATKREYADLLKELHKQGYRNLKIVERRTSTKH